MQQGNFVAAEVVYRKVQMVSPDSNKACNLALCLVERDLWKVEELLSRVVAETSSPGGGSGAAHDDGQQQLEDDDDDWVEREILKLLDVAVTQQYRKNNNDVRDKIGLS
jgi:hypothetical protein